MILKKLLLLADIAFLYSNMYFAFLICIFGVLNMHYA